MISVISISEDGEVTAMAGGLLSLSELGTRRTERASRLEFNETTNLWEVIDAKGGPVIFSHADYDVALAWEIEHYNQKILEA